MREDLDKKLCEDFPNLYADRHKSMHETAMSWGFDISDHWFQPIYELSQKLETLIVEFKEKYKDEMNCIYCSRKEKDHTDFYTFTEDGNTQVSIDDIVKYTSENPPNSEKVFKCKKFDPNFPRAAQVKEKYGTLRFYMTSETDEMNKLIDEAEDACAEICDDCGKPGELCTTGGWLKTLCNDCVITSNGRYRKCSDKQHNNV